ncbi:MAG: TonB-dependent receptor [Gemmatimonadota bacterium]|nr:TonB-dependent receptor [Gemmatimonadota bacterium]
MKTSIRPDSAAGRRALVGMVALGALTSPWLPAESHAQQAPPPDSVISLPTPVVVRVLRGSSGQGLPVPVTVVAGEELRRATSGAFLEEALRAVPGLQIQNRFNLSMGERIAVRGFGGRSQFGVRGLRVLVDGIPATLPDGQSTLDHLDLAGLDRVEILRGPGASLYGNAAGGVLHLETTAPGLSGSSARLRTVGGSHGLFSIQGTAEGRSGEMGYRASFTRLNYDGFRRDPVADDGSTYGEAERSVANASITLPLWGGTVRAVAAGVDLAAENPGSLSQVLLAQGDRQAFRFNVLNGTRKDMRQGQLGVFWEGEVSGSTAEIATWGVRRELDNPIPSAVIGLDRNAGGLRALLRRDGRSGDHPFTLAGGVEVELQRDHRRNWENTGGDAGALVLDQDEAVTGTGLFAQGRWEVAPRVSGSAGVRFDHFRFRADDHFVAPGDPDDSGSRTMSALSPSLGLVVTTTSDWEVFASASSAFETPTTTELGNRPAGSGGFNEQLEPQRSFTVEGGVRGRLAALWSLEAALFRTNLRDELVPFEVPGEPSRTFYRNAGSSSHTGWEVSLQGRPVDAARVRVSYTRVDARFREYTVDGTDHSGNRIPGLAPNRVDAEVTLDEGPFFLTARGLHQDDIAVDDANASASEGYFLADVRGGMTETEVGGALVSPFVAVSNVLDARYNSSVVVNAFGNRFFEPGPGRTFQFGLSVGWKRQ